ncbi:MAG: L,D-transpeptidase family protein [Pseudomonadota bacterium]
MRPRFFAYILIFVLPFMLSACATLQTAKYPAISKDIAHKHTYKLTSGQDVIGKVYKTRVGFSDSISSIARRYDLGYSEVKQANPKANFLFPGETIILPKEYVLPPKPYRHGIVINVAELRLYYFSKDGTVSTYPVSLGRKGWRTPIAKTYVYRKKKDPTWWIPADIRAIRTKKMGKESVRTIPPGPENPLGSYAIYLAMNGYLIHGTNNPLTIGLPVSAGCIRMYNRDVEDLFSKVKRGTQVNIIYYPVKAGWRDGRIYVEAHHENPSEAAYYSEDLIPVDKVIDTALAEHKDFIHWPLVNKVIGQKLGIPFQVGQIS